MHQDNEETYKKVFRDRLTELQMQKNVSEYRMSYDLGNNRNYVQSLSSGKVLPRMGQFFRICDYFGITPCEFFDSDFKNPDELHELLNLSKQLSPDELRDLLGIVRRLADK